MRRCKRKHEWYGVPGLSMIFRPKGLQFQCIAVPSSIGFQHHHDHHGGHTLWGSGNWFALELRASLAMNILIGKITCTSISMSLARVVIFGRRLVASYCYAAGIRAAVNAHYYYFVRWSTINRGSRVNSHWFNLCVCDISPCHRFFSLCTSPTTPNGGHIALGDYRWLSRYFPSNFENYWQLNVQCCFQSHCITPKIAY